MKEVNEPASFAECGIDEKEYMKKMPDIANKAFEDQCTTANPKLPLVTEIEEIMVKAYKGEQNYKSGRYVRFCWFCNEKIIKMLQKFAILYGKM